MSQSYRQNKEALFCSLCLAFTNPREAQTLSSLACPTSHTYTRELESVRRATYTEVALLRHISSDPREARARTFSWDLRCRFTESKSAGGQVLARYICCEAYQQKRWMQRQHTHLRTMNSGDPGCPRPRSTPHRTSQPTISVLLSYRHCP